MLMVNQLIGFGAYSAPLIPPSVVFRAAYESTSDLTTYTFTAADIAASAANKAIGVVIDATANSGGFTVSSVTIDGVSAPVVAHGEGANRGISAIAIAMVPGGPTGNIVVTFSGGVVRCGIGVWALYDLTSTTAAATASSNSATSVQSLNINVALGDIVLAGAYINGDAGAQTCTWTGVTEQYDNDLEGARHSGGHYLALSAETPRTVAGTFVTAGDRGSGAAAAFR